MALHFVIVKALYPLLLTVVIPASSDYLLMFDNLKLQPNILRTRGRIIFFF
nr:MAG TPA_asm: hypothetical protein [Caudoviricetes sp.]